MATLILLNKTELPKGTPSEALVAVWDKGSVPDGQISIPVELAQYVPRNIAKKYCVVPVKLVRNSLYLAMSDPLDFVAQDEVKPPPVSASSP